jgi:RimJ/RimL family protein N-acetyltransferase
MTNITVRHYRIEDMLAIYKEKEPDGNPADWIKTAETRAEFGPAYTFFHGETILACAGVTIYWEGVGEVWLCTSKNWKDYAYSAVIWTRKILDRLQDENKLWRIQADVVAEKTAARRFVEHFGFKAEGLMRRYDVLGRDCIRYARIREGVGA